MKRKSVAKFWPFINTKVFWISAIILLSVLSAINVFLTRINHDVAYFLYVAGSFIDGAELYVDQIDVNPPLIVCLTVPPVFVSRLTGLSEILLIKCYILSLIIVSVLLCFFLLRKIYSSTSSTTQFCFLFYLIYSLTAFPGYEFGQREHLLLILTLPYLISSIGRVRQTHLNWKILLFVGILAGLGISLKPYYILLFLSNELYLYFGKHSKPFWYSIECITILAVISVYSLSVVIITPEYLTVVKTALKIYDAYNIPLSMILKKLLHINPIVPFVLFIIFRPRTRIAEMRELFFIGTIVYTGIYLIQHKGFSYHFLPITTTAILLFISVILSFFESPKVYGKLFRSILNSMIILPLFYILAFSVKDTVSLAGQSPTFVEQIAENARPYAEGKHILVLSTSIYPGFPLVNHLKAKWALNVSCLWMIPKFYSREDMINGEVRYHKRDEMDEIEKFAFDSVISNMKHNKPALVIINSNPRKQAFRIPFNFLDYFLQNPEFKEEWKNYIQVTSAYNFDVYLLRSE